MSNLTEKCRVCGEQHTISFDNIINAGGHPELKEKVSSGEYFTWECEQKTSSGVFPACTMTLANI